MNFRYKESRVRAVMKEVLREKLDGMEYNPDNSSVLAREISDEIKRRLAEVRIFHACGYFVKLTSRC